MSRFKIQDKEDKTIIEIIAININDKHEVLTKEDGRGKVILLNDLLDMICGTKEGDVATHIILDE